MIVSGWVRPVKMGMLYIIHLIYLHFSLYFLGSFCFLHFRHKTWMYDTIRFFPGFHYFQPLHFICEFMFVCVWILLQYTCVRVSVCMCVRLLVSMSLFESECVYVCKCAVKIADTVLFISVYFHYRSPVSYQ